MPVDDSIRGQHSSVIVVITRRAVIIAYTEFLGFVEGKEVGYLETWLHG